MKRIYSHRDLTVYQMAFAVAMGLLPFIQRLPTSEKRGLAGQLRRGRRSVRAAIAKAGRKRRYPAAFLAKHGEAEVDSAEMQVHLQFMAAEGSMDTTRSERFIATCERMIKQLVAMASAPSDRIARPPGPQSPYPTVRQ